MSYQALYRKYRPKVFSDVKGQEAVVTTLRNQLASGRTGHAYLFCGTRGTGKTTVAKIFAKALNCENPGEDGPCGECERCRSIEDGSSMNVIEIDGASNNRVDDIRQIVDEVQYSPADGGRKVYIIDEVHMVTANAFNALLKTLEEPPEYLTFILATTDPQKVLPTILSRCQRYDFKRIPIETIVDRIRELLDNEGIEAEDRALFYIARLADGALRDALSLLEECVSYFFGKELTFERVLTALGAVDQSAYHDLTKAVAGGRVDDVVGSVEALVVRGKDLQQFADEYVWYLRNLLITKVAEDVRQLIDVSDENIEELRGIAADLEEEQIIRYIHVVSRLIADMRTAADRRAVFEIALIRLCRPQMERDFDSLIDRMKEMERELEELQDKLEAGVYSVSVRTPSAGPAPNPKTETEQKPIRPEAIPDDVREIVAHWKHIEQAVAAAKQGMMLRFLQDCILSVDEEGHLILVFREEFEKRFFEKDNKKALNKLSEIIGETTGKSVTILTKDASQAKTRAQITDIRKIINKVEVQIED